MSVYCFPLFYSRELFALWRNWRSQSLSRTFVYIWRHVMVLALVTVLLVTCPHMLRPVALFPALALLTPLRFSVAFALRNVVTSLSQLQTTLARIKVLLCAALKLHTTLKSMN